VRRGTAASVAQWIQDDGGTVLADLGSLVDGISAAGGTPAGGRREAVNGPARALGVIQLKDIVKEGISERFARCAR
jgi:K+-transporting ATPase ATPase B chain